MKILKPIMFLTYLTLCLAELDFTNELNFTNDKDTGAFCFKFTWLGPMYNNSSKINCKSRRKYKGVPCIEPVITTKEPPNMINVWNTWDGELTPESKVCFLKPGYTCIKYSSKFNDAIIYTTYYCGKIIENNRKAITTGCFEEEVDGYLIEVCGCQSYPGTIPCNASEQYTNSKVLLVYSIIILFYNSIKN